MSKESRSGSLTSDLSVKAIAPVGNADDQLISALVKRILSKVTFNLGVGVRYTDCF
jgi:hypothetical protein